MQWVPLFSFTCHNLIVMSITGNLLFAYKTQDYCNFQIEHFVRIWEEVVELKGSFKLLWNVFLAQSITLLLFGSPKWTPGCHSEAMASLGDHVLTTNAVYFVMHCTSHFYCIIIMAGWADFRFFLEWLWFPTSLKAAKHVSFIEACLKLVEIDLNMWAVAVSMFCLARFCFVVFYRWRSVTDLHFNIL